MKKFLLVLTLSAVAAAGACKGNANTNTNTNANANSNVAVATATPTPVANMASGSDAEVKSKIEANLKAKNITGVTVSVTGGVATLTGTVPDAKFADAVMAANEAKPGKVENKLVKGK